MDIQQLIEKVLGAFKGNSNLLEAFKTNPVKAVEDILQIDLPDEQLNAIVQGVKGKIKLEEVAGAAQKLGILGKLFGK